MAMTMIRTLAAARTMIIRMISITPTETTRFRVPMMTVKLIRVMMVSTAHPTTITQILQTVRTYILVRITNSAPRMTAKTSITAPT